MSVDGKHPEGYPDSTAETAIKNICSRQDDPTAFGFMPVVYICSPYRGDKSYKRGTNEMDSAGVGIVGKCITACFMELWVTVFAGRGKAALCFSMCCEHSYP